MTAETVQLHLAPAELVGLHDLVGQFDELLTDTSANDAALARLAPTAYPEDPEAAREFRRLTEGDLFARRRSDAGVMIASLPPVGESHDGGPVALSLSAEEARAWMRTLSALRLVIATRLGIGATDDHEPDVPHHAVYDWLGYRLSELVDASA